MKLLVFAVSALACLTLVNTKSCQGSTCGGYHYNNKRHIGNGGGYNSQVGSQAEYTSSNANALDGGTDSMDRNDSVGGADISGDSGDEEGGVGKNHGGGIYGGNGRVYSFNGYRRNNNCQNCNIKKIGLGGPNFNTVRIRTRNQHKSSSV